MADLVTRLLLNNTQFDNNIVNSTKQLKRMQDNAGKVKEGFSSAIGTFGKFAGALGIAMGAGEALNKTLMSTQTTGDAFVKLQDQAKASVNAFFTSIAMGNFSSFLSGLDDVISKAGDLSVALDNLGTKTLFNNAEYNQLSTKYQLEVNAAKNRNISDAERNKHLEKAKSLMQEMISLRYGLQKANEEAAYTALQADVSKQGFHQNVKKETWEYLLKDSNRSKVENSASKYKQWDSRILASKTIDPETGIDLDTAETIRLKKEFDKYSKTAKGKYEKLAYIFLEMDDDEKSAIASAVKMRETANNIAVDISSKQLELNNAEAKINGGFNKKNKPDKEPKTLKPVKPNKEIIPEGSIADLQKQITDATKEFTNATTEAARTAIKKKIEELEEVIQVMNFKANHPNAPKVDISGKTSLKQEANPTAGLKVKGLVPTYTQRDIKTNNEYADSLNGIAQIMGNIQGATDNATASWLNYSSNILSGVAGMITAVMALSAANATEQATASGAAGAEAVKSAAQTPFIGWLMVGAAAASVIAALASLPKFASGGIFEGGSTVGDMNLARVNSGEMILNRGQQGRLFNMLNNGGSVATGGKVEFEIRADKLYGVLKNYNNKMGKIR